LDIDFRNNQRGALLLYLSPIQLHHFFSFPYLIRGRRQELRRPTALACDDLNVPNPWPSVYSPLLNDFSSVKRFSFLQNDIRRRQYFLQKELCSERGHKAVIIRTVTGPSAASLAYKSSNVRFI
jgi:hypothetical protein